MSTSASTTPATPIRVVVIEDSIPERDALVRALQLDGDIEVVGVARRAAEAIGLVRTQQPDLVTLDVQLSDGGGLEVIEQVMAFTPTPILVLSSAVTGPESQAAVDALVAGAVEAWPKPDEWDAGNARRLRERVRVLRGVTVVRHVRGRLRKGAATPPRAATAVSPATPVVGIASSTGGPAALATVLTGLGGLRAAVLVVQHLHPDFVDGFVQWMARVAALPVELAADGARIKPGVAYIAPGGAHLVLGHGDRLALQREPETLHRPSADVLFRSLAERPRGTRVGVLLTGIGSDGAAGLLELRRKGGITIAQDEATSAVYGMPAAAQRLGAVQHQVALDRIAATIVRST
jgi:two-component system chemotaxis response regulator CheB